MKKKEQDTPYSLDVNRGIDATAIFIGVALAGFSYINLQTCAGTLQKAFNFPVGEAYILASAFACALVALSLAYGHAGRGTRWLLTGGILILSAWGVVTWVIMNDIGDASVRARQEAQTSASYTEARTAWADRAAAFAQAEGERAQTRTQRAAFNAEISALNADLAQNAQNRARLQEAKAFQLKSGPGPKAEAIQTQIDKLSLTAGDLRTRLDAKTAAMSVLPSPKAVPHPGPEPQKADFAAISGPVRRVFTDSEKWGRAVVPQLLETLLCSVLSYILAVRRRRSAAVSTLADIEAAIHATGTARAAAEERLAGARESVHAAEAAAIAAQAESASHIASAAAEAEAAQEATRILTAELASLESGIRAADTRRAAAVKAEIDAKAALAAAQKKTEAVQKTAPKTVADMTDEQFLTLCAVHTPANKPKPCWAAVQRVLRKKGIGGGRDTVRRRWEKLQSAQQKIIKIA